MSVLQEVQYEVGLDDSVSQTAMLHMLTHVGLKLVLQWVLSIYARKEAENVH